MDRLGLKVQAFWTSSKFDEKNAMKVSMAKVLRLSLKFLPWYPSLAVLGYGEAEHALLIAGVRGRWVDDLGVDVDIEAGSLTDQEEAQNTERRDELEPGHLRQFCFRIFHSRWFSRKTRRSFNFFRWFHFSWKKSHLLSLHSDSGPCEDKLSLPERKRKR